MQAVLECDLREKQGHWDTRLLRKRVGGVRLIDRQLLTLREVGIDEVFVNLPEEDRLREVIEKLKVPGLAIRWDGPRPEKGIVLRGDTIVDPRMLKQLLSLDSSGNGGGPNLVAVDRYPDNYDPKAKSPYRVGVPESTDIAAVDPSHEGTDWFPVGVEIRSAEPASSRCVSIGRYYWHRIQGARDASRAAWKILLATMKKTDGVYARTNRRVSLRISRMLIGTPVTPNMVTLGTLVCSIAAGVLFAQGTYPWMVVGAFLSWFASMLDGVDGELARAKFKSSDFGCWLEMVCDYLYYLFVFLGLGIGLYRSSGDLIWLIMGLLLVPGVILSFTVIARQRKRHAEEESASSFGEAFQKKTEAHSDNPAFAFLRTCQFLATRAALPYYIFFFVLVGFAKGLMVFFFVGTMLALALTSYSSRLFKRR